jgi:hypothetical protein
MFVAPTLGSDTDYRAVTIWLRGDPGAGDLSHLLELPADPPIRSSPPVCRRNLSPDCSALPVPE